MALFLEAKDLKNSEELYIVAAKFAPNSETDRGFISLTMAKEPTSVNIESPTMTFKLLFPRKDDTLMAKIAMQGRIKNVIGSLIEIEKGTSAIALGSTIKEALKEADIKVLVELKMNEGRNLDKDGNTMIFTEIQKMTVLESLPKGEFEEFIDFDTEVPF